MHTISNFNSLLEQLIKTETNSSKTNLGKKINIGIVYSRGRKDKEMKQGEREGWKIALEIFD